MPWTTVLPYPVFPTRLWCVVQSQESHFNTQESQEVCVYLPCRLMILLKPSKHWGGWGAMDYTADPRSWAWVALLHWAEIATGLEMRNRPQWIVGWSSLFLLSVPAP